MEKKNHYIKFGTRPSSVARNESFIRYMLKEGVESFVTVPIDSHNSDYLVERDSWHRFLKKLFENTLKEWKLHLQNYLIKRAAVISTVKKVKDVVKEKKDNMEIFNAYKKYFETVIDFGPYLLFPYSLKEYVEQGIMEEFPNDFETITSLSRPTIFHRFQKALLTEPANEIKEKFGWLNVYSLIEKPYTIKQIEKLKKSVNEKEVKNIFNSFGENKKRFENFIAKVKNPEKIATCTLMHEYIFLRTDRIDAWKETLYRLIPFFEHLASLISPQCRLEHAVELTVKEIKSVLEGKKKPSVEKLEKRAAKEGIFYYAPGKFKFIFDAKEKKEILKNIEGTLVKGDTIVGMTACMGHATGEVKVIRKEEDFKNFKEGQILVACFTEPKFTIYMDKAAAIITDEGGITSHAAIISREFGIPCVIGTNIATKAFKDGDLVEVDADKSVIKIIKRNET